MGYAEILALQFPDKTSPEGEAAEVILRSSERAAELTRQLLGFARKGKYNPVPMNVNLMIGNSVKISEKIFDKKISVQYVFEKDIRNVFMDIHQFQQVLTNLFINARDAMPDGGILSIETKNAVLNSHLSCMSGTVEPGSYVLVSISDTGTGIPPEIMDKIFEPFFTTKREGKGTGLGLSTVYGIVKNHNGHINVKSFPGKGTTFELYIPATEENGMEGRDPADKLELGNARILLVDDEHTVRNLARNMLETLGYNVLTAKDGSEAIRMYQERKNEIDLIILDIIMPGISGGDIFNNLFGINPGVKILLASGYSREGQASDLLERGAIGFLQKPFHLSDLSKEVAEALRK